MKRAMIRNCSIMDERGHRMTVLIQNNRMVIMIIFFFADGPLTAMSDQNMGTFFLNKFSDIRTFNKFIGLERRFAILQFFFRSEKGQAGGVGAPRHGFNNPFLKSFP